MKGINMLNGYRVIGAAEIAELGEMGVLDAISRLSGHVSDLAKVAGVEPCELLDELVYEVSGRTASQDVNHGAHPEMSAVDAHDEVHGRAEQAASDINNGGVPAQLGYLFDQLGEQGVREALLAESDVVCGPAALKQR